MQGLGFDKLTHTPNGYYFLNKEFDEFFESEFNEIVSRNQKPNYNKESNDEPQTDKKGNRLYMNMDDLSNSDEDCMIVVTKRFKLYNY